MKNNVITLNDTLHEGRTTVMSETGYHPVPRTGGGNGAFSILFSLFLIFGGMSGRFVLRGTNSSTALVVAGILFLIWDIVSIVRQKAEREKAEAEYSERFGRVRATEKAAETDKRMLPAPVAVRVVYDQNTAGLDVTPRLNGQNMQQNIKERTYTGTTQQVKNTIAIVSLDVTAVFEVAPVSGEIVVELFRDKNGFGLALPNDTVYPAAS